MTAKLSPVALLLALAASCAALPAQAAAETAKTRAETARLSKIAADAKVRQVLDSVKKAGRDSLTAPEGKLVCDAYGIAVPKEGVAASAADATNSSASNANTVA